MNCSYVGVISIQETLLNVSRPNQSYDHELALFINRPNHLSLLIYNISIAVQKKTSLWIFQTQNCNINILGKFDQNISCKIY